MRNRRWFLLLFMTLLVSAVFLPFILSGYSEITKAEQAYTKGDYKQATVSYVRAAHLLPWRNDLYEMAGISAGAANDPSSAISYLKLAPKLSEHGWVALGYAQFTSGDMNAALKTTESGLKEYSSSAALYQLSAFLHRSQKDWPAERAALQNQIIFDEQNAYAHYRLGLLLTLLDPSLALDQLTLASARDPEFDSAVQTLRGALELSGKEISPSARLVTVGRAFGLLQEWDLALTAFEDAIASNPENAEAWAWLGEAKQQTGMDGRVELDRALSLDGKSVIVRALRGMYWSRQGNYQQMLIEYLQAAGQEPQNPTWRASIADGYLKLGNLTAALEAYQQATDLAPKDANYWRLLAVFCAENGVRVEDIGLPAAQKAVELAPDDLAVRDTLGWSYASSGRYQLAEQTLLDVISRDKAYLPAHLHLAMNYLAQGNRAPAFNELTFVRGADPDGANGKLAEQMLKQYFP